MKMLLAACSGLLIVGLAPCDLLAQAGFERVNREAAQNGWRFDYDQAKADARAAGRPLMVVFRCVP